MKIRQEATPSEDCSHRLSGARAFDGIVHEATHALEALEVRGDERTRLVARDAEIACEPRLAHSVHEPEVDRLCAATHLARHLIARHLEDERCGVGMNVD